MMDRAQKLITKPSLTQQYVRGQIFHNFTCKCRDFVIISDMAVISYNNILYIVKYTNRYWQNQN